MGRRQGCRLQGGAVAADVGQSDEQDPLLPQARHFVRMTHERVDVLEKEDDPQAIAGQPEERLVVGKRGLAVKAVFTMEGSVKEPDAGAERLFRGERAIPEIPKRRHPGRDASVSTGGLRARRP